MELKLILQNGKKNTKDEKLIDWSFDNLEKWANTKKD